MFYCSLFLLPVLLSACSPARPITTDSAGIAPQVMLDVPFYPQQIYHCGPAALAGLLEFNGRYHSPAELAEWIYIPDRKGSLQIEIQAAIRRAGLLAYPLKGELAYLLQQLDAGQPVLVLQNLGLASLPQWHYATLIGYDLEQQQLVLHSGTYPNYRISINTFLNTWERAGRWSILALPPSRLPAYPQAEVFLQAAADLESVGQQQAAIDAYSTALSRWPQQGLSLMGLGNLYYARAEYKASVTSFGSLVQLQPDNTMAWNNLAYAYEANGCHELALASIQRALALSPADPRLLDSRKELTRAAKQPLESRSSCEELKVLLP